MESSVLKWVEISDECQQERFTALSEELRSAGLQNQIEFLQADASSFPQVLSEAQKSFHQIRVGGSLREHVLAQFERVPQSLRFLRAADAVCNESGVWWPRQFLSEGFLRTIASDIGQVDLTGSVLVVGSGADAWSVLASLVRVGFRRFSFADPDDERGQRFMAEAAKTFLNVQYQFVPRHMITQAPAIHSFAINTIQSKCDDGFLQELAFFNFLKTGGAWLDIRLRGFSRELENEALSVGAVIANAPRVFAFADSTWAESSLGVKINLDRYSDVLESHYRSEKSDS